VFTGDPLLRRKCFRVGGNFDTGIDDWQHVFRVNFFAPIMLARGLVNELQRAQGAVVNVTSIAGSRVHPFAGAAYATSKAALASLTRAQATEAATLIGSP